jgi:replicative DNA helicase
VRTGQKGDKSRGQTPNLLIVDEGDMLDDETLESILASLTGTGPIAQMILSSTPTGRREMFYKWCVNKALGFREFHYSSMVSPNWSAEMELFYRETYSENAFAHEFLAEFGEMEIGIFQHKFVEASLADYSITKAEPARGDIHAFGVDWNRKGVGVHIIVSAYSPETGKMRPVYKEVISAGEFTQHKSISRIAELNTIWNPEWIYVDEGDGTTQIEALKLWGMQHPTTRLHRKIRGIDFGSTTMIRDPLTKAFVKKAVKPLVVDMCARNVERLNVVLPRAEDTSTGLVGQMREFRILRYGRDARPVYSDDKEHTLIAWMLSIFAFVMEMTDLAKVNSSNRVAFTGHMGTGDTQIIPFQSREFREKRDKVASRPRTFDTGRKDVQDLTFDEFIGRPHPTEGRKFRNVLGRVDRTVPGFLGRPTWEKKSHRDPKDD